MRHARRVTARVTIPMLTHCNLSPCYWILYPAPEPLRLAETSNGSLFTLELAWNLRESDFKNSAKGSLLLLAGSISLNDGSFSGTTGGASAHGISGTATYTGGNETRPECIAFWFYVKT
jgi:hypothetical protein